MESPRSDDASCEDLATTIQQRIDILPPYSTKRCIYRVPNLLRQTNEQAYTPTLVSVGPLHHTDARFLPMEAHKLKYLQSFLRDSKMNADLNSHLMIVKEMEDEIRECYADPINLSSDDFTEMILIDSVFIIELFRKMHIADLSKMDDDYVYGRPFLIHEVLRDIILAENQIPFFILTILYGIAFKPHEDPNVPYFTEIACKALQVNKSKINVDTFNEASCKHLLDLLLCHYKPKRGILRTIEDHVATNIYDNAVCPTATNLHEAGVKFKVVPSGDSSKLLDIHFDAEKGILTIPKLEVMDSTERTFRNLIAFEQCHIFPQDAYIAYYQSFLVCLIETPKDVRLLVKAGIIENWVGSCHQVSEIFNSLGQNVYLYVKEYTYLGIAQQLNTHYNKRRNRFRAALKNKCIF